MALKESYQALISETVDLVFNEYIAKELDRISPREDGARHNPAYIGGIRAGNHIPSDLLPWINQAEANLRKRVGEKKKSRRRRIAKFSFASQ